MGHIASVEIHRLEVPLVTPYRLAFGPVHHFDTLVVEIIDDAGRHGLGEATVLTGYTTETIAGSHALMQQLARAAVGLPIEEARRQWQSHIQHAPFTVTALVTATEMLEGNALLDVASASAVPLLAPVNSENPEALEAEIDRLLARGFRTLKVKVGFDVDNDLKRLRLVQQVSGGRAALRVDANQGYSVDEALRFAAAIDPTDIELFEQPCAAGDWEAASAVAAVSPVPMMLDESIYGPSDIERAAELRAAHYIKLKLMKFGGVERLAAAIHLVRALGMEPVLGNGVACEIGCWMEALVARTLIRNAGEMNGYLKQATPLLLQPPPCEYGEIQLEPGYRPELDRIALGRMARDRVLYAAPALAAG